jgi:hypothetical protein
MKTANNILELLLDPTVFPIKQRVYFGPGENLRNESYDKAKEEALALYGNQSQNTDFYPGEKKLLHNLKQANELTLFYKNFVSKALRISKNSKKRPLNTNEDA